MGSSSVPCTPAKYRPPGYSPGAMRIRVPGTATATASIRPTTSLTDTVAAVAVQPVMIAGHRQATTAASLRLPIFSVLQI